MPWTPQSLRLLHLYCHYIWESLRPRLGSKRHSVRPNNRRQVELSLSRLSQCLRNSEVFRSLYFIFQKNNDNNNNNWILESCLLYTCQITLCEWWVFTPTPFPKPSDPAAHLGIPSQFPYFRPYIEANATYCLGMGKSKGCTIFAGPYLLHQIPTSVIWRRKAAPYLAGTTKKVREGLQPFKSVNCKS